MPTNEPSPEKRPPALMPEIRRQVDIHKAHPKLRLTRREVERVIAVLDENREKFLGGCPSGDLSLAFLTDHGLAQVHGDFMDDPSVTDVITFEGDPAMGNAGEICVSADTAARFVKLPSSRSRSLPAQEKFSTELTLYIVHGWLHLAGYDDLQPAKKRRMRAAEKRAMALLRKHHAIPSFKLD